MMHLDTGKGLVVLGPPGTVVLETDSLDGNEVRCVLRSPVHVQSIHVALIGRVEVRGLLDEVTLKAEVHASYNNSRIRTLEERGCENN